MTGWLPRAALVFLTCIAVAAFCEILLRALDFPAADFSPWVPAAATGFAYAPSIHTRFRREGEFDIDFATNSCGLRDDEIGLKTRSRVLLLGDSFASGYGVERGEMFADLLENDLNVDVVNASVGGYELVHQVRYFESHGSPLQPDVVLYALYLANDISRNEEWREGRDGTLVPVGRHPPLRSAGASKLLTLLWSARYRERLRRDDLRGEWEPFPDYLTICERPPSERAQSQWDLAERLLGQLQHRVIESGAMLVVASFSHRTANDPAARAIYLRRHPDFIDDHDFSVPRQRIGQIADRLHIPLIDLDAAIDLHYAHGGEPLYFPRDGHWNALGHRVAATALVAPMRAVLDGDLRQGHSR